MGAVSLAIISKLTEGSTASLIGSAKLFTINNNSTKPKYFISKPLGIKHRRLI